MYTKVNLLKTVEPIVRHAGDIVLSYFHKNLKHTEKDGQGFVTEADIASEKHLIQALGNAFPDTAFLAEESGKSGKSGNGYCWVIDPIDGTTNFAQGLPYFCISVALTHNGQPIFGVIFHPLLKEFFYAYKGEGAFLNGERMQVSQKSQLQKNMLLIGLPYTKSKMYRYTLERVALIAPQALAFRHLGAAALDLAYVASGRLDAVFFAELSWWDIAAGMLLVQEAGGIVTDFQGEQIGADYKSLIAGGRDVHERLLKLLKNTP